MDETAKEDAFYTDVEFGTAGMRGILGAGTNRLNIYVIQKANVGFAKYIDNNSAFKAGSKSSLQPIFDTFRYNSFFPPLNISISKLFSKTIDKCNRFQIIFV